MTDRFEAHQTIKQRSRHPSGGRLCFQWGTYHYGDRPSDLGYRFVWEDIDGRLSTDSIEQRVSLRDMDELLDRALQAGRVWAKTLGVLASKKASRGLPPNLA